MIAYWYWYPLGFPIFRVQTPTFLSHHSHNKKKDHQYTYRETFNSIRLGNLATIVSNNLGFFFFFFFLISNKNLYSKIPPHAESHKVEIKITEKEDKK